MAEYKLNIGDPKSGKTFKRVLAADQARALMGKKIGDTVAGDPLGLSGYELQITGGSDHCGFPMRADVPGAVRRRILITGGVGFRNKDGEGVRRRRTVAGNTVHTKTAQINVKVVKAGKGPLGEAKEEKASE